LAGEIADIIWQIQSSSALLERLSLATNSTKVLEYEKAEAVLENTVELVQLFTQATLLTAGFHSHPCETNRRKKSLKKLWSGHR